MEYKFVISSLNTEKLINKLIEKYSIFNLQKNNKYTSFCCLKKDRKKISKILQRAGFKSKTGNFVGFFKYFKNIFSYGIICGIFLSLIFFLINSFFISDVLILGNVNYTYKDVVYVLEQNNVSRWSFKSSIDTKKLQNQILGIKYISYASVLIKGNALVVNLKEQLTNPEVVNIGAFSPIVSNYDCKITSVNLVQGTAKVKVGDIVKIGDVLVEPYTVDASGKKLSVQPLADISADVWITSSIDFFDKKVVKQRTGRVISNYNISFLGVEVYGRNNKVNFDCYDTEELDKYVSSTLIPIKIKYTNFYEYNVLEQDINFEANKQIFVEQTRQTCLLNLNNYDIIKNESYVITKNYGFNTIAYTITFNKKIC